jgi:hypothetical protein
MMAKLDQKFSRSNTFRHPHRSAARFKASRRQVVSRAKTNLSIPVRMLGRPTKLYVNVTFARPFPIRSNLHEPENDRKNHGPLVISIAQAPAD